MPGPCMNEDRGFKKKKKERNLMLLNLEHGVHSTFTDDVRTF